MKKILFTGFEPFGGETINPSWEAVSLLPCHTGRADIAKLHLPVEYDSLEPLLVDAIEKVKPDAVICVGQAGGRAVLTPEFVAINQKDASIPDNAGISYAGVPIHPEGPDAYFSTLPVKAITAAMKEAGIPAAVSYSAGAYVCNALMYTLLSLLESRYPHIRGGFIHIPFSCAQAAAREKPTPSLPVEFMAKGLSIAADTVAVHLEKSCEDFPGSTGCHNDPARRITPT